MARISFPVKVKPDFAEGDWSIFLSTIVPQLNDTGTSRWLGYMKSRQWTYVLRTILMDRDQYTQHLGNAVAHDLTQASEAEIALLDTLPQQFWMVEFSLPALYTGNHSKLGEVLLDSATAPDPTDIAPLFLGARFPSTLILKDSLGALEIHPSSMQAHMPLYRPWGHSHEW